MLTFRYNHSRNCWEQYGFLKGAIVPIWKWIAVECDWVKKCIDAGKAFIDIEGTMP